MNIIYGGYPPNYEEIAKAFNIRGNTNIVFTYGNKLFVPNGRPVDKYLLKHEETHARQQTAVGPEHWWKQYLVDPSFRFTNELEAYREQYRSMSDLPFATRVGYLEHITNDLAGEMYGGLVTVAEAKAAITEGIVLKRPVSSKNINIRRAKKLQRQNRKKGRK